MNLICDCLMPLIINLIYNVLSYSEGFSDTVKKINLLIIQSKGNAKCCGSVEYTKYRIAYFYGSMACTCGFSSEPAHLFSGNALYLVLLCKSN